MALFTLPLDVGGPLITAYVAVSRPRGEALLAASQSVPAPVQVRALVDTGASCTCIDPAVFQALGLTPTGVMPILTGTTGANPHSANQYDVSLVIPGLHQQQPLWLQALPVSELVLSPQGIDALIGRDILDQCLLVYNGSLSEFTIAF